MHPLLSPRVALAILPLVILGYLLGMMMSAVLDGWSVSPWLVGLNVVGIVLALQRIGAIR